MRTQSLNHCLLGPYSFFLGWISGMDTGGKATFFAGVRPTIILHFQEELVEANECEKPGCFSSSL